MTPDFPVSMDVLEDEGKCGEVYLLPVFGGPSGSYRRRPCQEGEADEWDTDEEAEVQDDASTISDENWAYEKHLQITGLVLQACGEDTDNRGRFSRVGSFNFENFIVVQREDNAWDRDYYRDFIKVLDARQPERAGAEYSHASSSHDDSKDWISITIE